MQNDKSKFKNTIILIVIAATITVIIVIASQSSKKTLSNILDTFAQCLKDKGAVMYGADWCPHCQNEKKAFGDSFRLVPYVECPDNPQVCIEKGIQGYPTWIFSDGGRFEGEQGLQKLSAASGCALP